MMGIRFRELFAQVVQDGSPWGIQGLKWEPLKQKCLGEVLSFR